MRLILTTEPNDSKKSPCEELAFAVVANAVSDYHRAQRHLERLNHIKFLNSHERDSKFQAEHAIELATEFLEGKTGIAIFWLTAAGLPTDADINEIMERSRDYKTDSNIYRTLA